MAAGDGAQLPATVAASRSVEKALEEAALSGALNLANRSSRSSPAAPGTTTCPTSRTQVGRRFSFLPLGDSSLA
ncbi:unnamed protein product [Tetraodon nigroviridis]|uniref:(spotted green pufferfish) hypothetical protein n=1 Tax=Tetraodon nigroviridis TaxID=99883 RepID=Q4T9I6_TETNG|nr:unnamed protein product [Tetraodon nigroviridis]